MTVERDDEKRSFTITYDLDGDGEIVWEVWFGKNEDGVLAMVRGADGVWASAQLPNADARALGEWLLEVTKKGETNGVES